MVSFLVKRHSIDYSPFHGRPVSTARSSRVPSVVSPRDRSPDQLKQGYLFKRTSGVVAANWKRRFFSIESGLLMNVKRGRPRASWPSLELRLCSVKISESTERRFSFEVISPSKWVDCKILFSPLTGAYRMFVLQAESEQDLLDWMQSLQFAIATAIQAKYPARPSVVSLQPKVGSYSSYA